MAGNELRDLARDIARAAATIEARAVAVVAKGALNVKNEARRNAAGSAGRHGRLYPGSIGYDVSATGLAADIGPEAAGQGNLAMLEYGSVHNPPHRDLGRALDIEEPRFIAAAAELGVPWA